jgi:hypothetical protein
MMDEAATKYLGRCIVLAAVIVVLGLLVHAYVGPGRYVPINNADYNTHTGETIAPKAGLIFTR